MWKGVGDWTKTATYWPPQPLRTSPCVVLVLLACSTGELGVQPLWDMFPFQHLVNLSDLQLNRGSRGPLLLGGGFLYHILSLTRLSPTHWLPVLTELYNSSIAHSVSILMASEAGICHFRCLWTGMFDHHQAEITVMQFRGHSLPVHLSMSIPWDFTLSHFVSQARLRDFFS